MASWDQILAEIKQSGTTYDAVRRKHLRHLHKVSKRNVIVYYSGWLQKEELSGSPGLRFDLNDADKDSLMATIHKLGRTKGLDLILHTPGGEIAATESIVDYLRAMFPNNIRAIVPQLAMSAGTMIACACDEIVMEKHSSLGPIDPQFRGLPAHGIVEEFRRAATEIKNQPSSDPTLATDHCKIPSHHDRGMRKSDQMVRGNGEKMVGFRDVPKRH